MTEHTPYSFEQIQLGEIKQTVFFFQELKWYCKEISDEFSKLHALFGPENQELDEIVQIAFACSLEGFEETFQNLLSQSLGNPGKEVYPQLYDLAASTRLLPLALSSVSAGNKLIFFGLTDKIAGLAECYESQP